MSNWLTASELRVLICASEGMTGRETAEFLFNSEHTIRAHRKKLIKKLGAGNITGAVAIAMRAGVIH